MEKRNLKIIVSGDINFYGSSKDSIQKILGSNIGVICDGGETFTIIEGTYEISLSLVDMINLTSIHEFKFIIVSGVIYLQ